MAAISTAVAGLWSVDANWVGGVTPGVDDDVTVLHAMTVDQTTTIGSLEMGAAVTVQIANFVTLTIVSTLGGVTNSIIRSANLASANLSVGGLIDLPGVGCSLQGSSGGSLNIYLTGSALSPADIIGAIEKVKFRYASGGLIPVVIEGETLSDTEQAIVDAFSDIIFRYASGGLVPEEL